MPIGRNELRPYIHYPIHLSMRIIGPYGHLGEDK